MFRCFCFFLFSFLVCLFRGFLLFFFFCLLFFAFFFLSFLFRSLVVFYILFFSVFLYFFISSLHSSFLAVPSRGPSTFVPHPCRHPDSPFLPSLCPFFRLSFHTHKSPFCLRRPLTINLVMSNLRYLILGRCAPLICSNSDVAHLSLLVTFLELSLQLEGPEEGHVEKKMERVVREQE